MKNAVRHSRFPMIVTVVTVIFFYAPLLIVSAASFNNKRFGGSWGGFTFRWYEDLFTSYDIWEALVNTLIIAFSATAISTILGTLTALALYRSHSRLRSLHCALVYSPLVVPDILIGISMLMLFVSVFSLTQNFFGLKLEQGMTTIIIAHVTFCLSYVALVVLGRLQDFDDTQTEAAQDLGANPVQTFFKVTLPLIMPAVIAGALFAFTLSVDDYVITFFVSGAGNTTLPVFIQGEMRRGTPAVINALSVVFLIFTFIVVFITQKLQEAKK